MSTPQITTPSTGTPTSVREFTKGVPRKIGTSIHRLMDAVGQGTVLRKRRPERQRVQDTSITEATGLTLGEDGFPHPLETEVKGRLKVLDQETRDFVEEIMLTQRAILVGMARLSGTSVEELSEKALNSTELFGL